MAVMIIAIGPQGLFLTGEDQAISFPGKLWYPPSQGHMSVELPHSDWRGHDLYSLR